jgi:hypothetical protein
LNFFKRCICDVTELEGQLDFFGEVVDLHLVAFVVGVMKGFMIDQSRNPTLEDRLIEVLEQKTKVLQTKAFERFSKVNLSLAVLVSYLNCFIAGLKNSD